MAHPHIQQAVALLVEVILDIAQQAGVAMRADPRMSVFPQARCRHLPAQLFRHGLHAVTDAEHRDTEREDDLRGPEAGGDGDGFRTAREDDGLWPEGLDGVRREVEGMDLAVDAGLADPSGAPLG